MGRPPLGIAGTTRDSMTPSRLSNLYTDDGDADADDVDDDDVSGDDDGDHVVNVYRPLCTGW